MTACPACGEPTAAGSPVHPACVGDRLFEDAAVSLACLLLTAAAAMIVVWAG